MKRILITIFTLAVVQLHAATFYIDFATGSDSNTSTQAQSQATPWKFAPGMTGATGAAASYSVQSGDVFVLKGGVTWTFASTATTLYLLPASNITVMGGQQLGTPWGTGLPVLDGAGVVGNGKYGILGSSRSGITIDGIRVVNITSNVDGSGSGIAALYVASDWDIKNCELTNCGVNSVTMSLVTSVGDGANFRMRNCVVTDCGRVHVVMGSGISFNNVEIDHNTFLGMGTWDRYQWLPIKAVASGGTGYAVGDQLSIVQGGGSGAVVQVSSVAGAGIVTGITQTSQGTGYSYGTALATTAITGVGTGCTVNQTEFHSGAAAVGGGGSGYVVGDQLTVTQTGASGALIQVASVSDGAIRGFIKLAKGTGYLAASNLQTVTLTGIGTGCMVNVTDYHGDGIMVGANSLTNPATLTNVSIHDNKFSDTWIGTALIYLNDGTGPAVGGNGGYGAKIFNNQFCIDSNGTISPAIIAIYNGWRNVEIYNNTIDASASVGAKVVGAGITCVQLQSDANIVVRNNIISGVDNGITSVAAAQAGILTADNNLYKTVSNNHFIWTSAGRFDTLSALRAAGYEANGATTTDVKFVTLPNGTDGHGDWHLQVASPAIGMGVNLSADIGTTDLDGISRTVPWDVGAYTYAEGTGGSTPAAPSSLSATATSSSAIGLAWSDNSDNETGFELERSADGSTWSQIATPAANATSASSTGLAASTTFYFRIRAVNAAGNSAYSSTASATTDAESAVPAPITNTQRTRATVTSGF